ncbi:hypothetical protein wcw_1371 [Waddlia chondrophila WSU 86-1044]|uniref:Uncharacterized protein n=1 Tax=Waddlia chondrophila (strain ATCC VR-1470 / WSU 86-1044) TaxID=716544 RepID=D6YRM7_WADCW|nr:hypothetical protein wcw_1371 [Waddlia chondrophila WSU 86-1044]
MRLSQPGEADGGIRDVRSPLREVFNAICDSSKDVNQTSYQKFNFKVKE